MSLDPTSRRKASKLKSPVTRDSFLTWDLNHQSYCRQDANFRKFLTGGTMSTWKSLDEDETHGVQIMKKLNYGTFMLDGDGHRILDEDATDTRRSALSEFLACLGAYCPENFIHTLGDGQN